MALDLGNQQAALLGFGLAGAIVGAVLGVKIGASPRVWSASSLDGAGPDRQLLRASHPQEKDDGPIDETVRRGPKPR